MTRVLIVDDHELFRAGVRAQLEPDVEVVGEASGVEDAVRLIGEVQPDVVLLDVHMPDGGGVEVLQRAAGIEPAPRFLALSASDAAEDVIAVIRAGARGYVTKSISGPELQNAIERVREGDAVFSPRLAGFVLDAFAGAAGVEPAAEGDDAEVDQLTPRERKVLRHLARGYLYKEIAQRLGISTKTVKAHVSSVLRKLQLSNRHQLSRWAQARRLDSSAGYRRPVATFYAHPDRETAVACSNCGRSICPDCMTPTSVGMRCPECSREKTRVVRRAYAGGEPIATYTLIGMNVLAFFATLASGSSVGGSVGGNSVLEKAALNGPKIADGEWWRIVTSGFMHYGLLHLLFNMYALYILGQLLEPAIGRLRFTLIYFVSLIAGSVGALILNPNALTAGASGAVFGLMGAAILIMRKRGISVMESGLGIWLFLNLAITFTVSNISVGGHIGGLIGGVLAGWVLVELPDMLRMPRWSAEIAAVLIGVAAFAAAISIA